MKNNYLRFFAVATALLLMLSMTACDTVKTTETPSAETPTPKPEKVELFTLDKQNNFVIVSEEVRFDDVSHGILITYDGARTYTEKLAKNIADEIEKKYSVKSDVADSSKPYESLHGLEVMIGNRLAPEGILAEKYAPTDGWSLTTFFDEETGRIKLAAGFDDEISAECAVEEICKKCFLDTKLVVPKTLSKSQYEANAHYQRILGEKEKTVSVSFEEGKEYVAKTTFLFDVLQPDSVHRIMQGSYFDGEIYTIAFYEGDETDSGVLLVQYDKAGKFIRQSEPLELDHSNNITYIPAKNSFLVAHCSGYGNYSRYSLVDADTLEETEIRDLSKPFFAMAYSPELDLFISGEWDGSTLDVWDSKFKAVMSFDVEAPKTTSQGCFATSDYMWFVRSEKDDNSAEIRLYDWKDGSLLHQIELVGMEIEPEAISVVDGKVYVLCNNESYTGGKVFEVTFEEK